MGVMWRGDLGGSRLYRFFRAQGTVVFFFFWLCLMRGERILYSTVCLGLKKKKAIGGLTVFFCFCFFPPPDGVLLF